MAVKKSITIILIMFLTIFIAGCTSSKPIVSNNKPAEQQPPASTMPAVANIVVLDYLTFDEIKAITGITPTKYITYNSYPEHAWAYYQMEDAGPGMGLKLSVLIDVGAQFVGKDGFLKSDPSASRNVLSTIEIFGQKGTKLTTYFLYYEGNDKKEAVKDITVELLKNNILYRMWAGGSRNEFSDQVFKALMERLITNMETKRK
ncbi:MAG: hypothetical protein Q8N36_06370 [bacterium]|nr:hypothetical protein [bacterium]